MRKFLTVLAVTLSLLGLTANPSGATPVLTGTQSGVTMNYGTCPGPTCFAENQTWSGKLYRDVTAVLTDWTSSKYNAGGDTWALDRDSCTESWVRPHTNSFRPPDVSWICRDNGQAYAGGGAMHYINSNGTLGAQLYYPSSGCCSDMANNGLDVAVCRVSVRNYVRTNGVNCRTNGASNITFGAYTGLSPQSIAWMTTGSKPEKITYGPDVFLQTDQILRSGDLIPAYNGNASVVGQSDGNFVQYNAAGTAIWSTGTSGHPGAILKFQSDGNLVVYSSEFGGTALWSSGTFGGPGRFLVMEYNGKFSMYSGGSIIWQRP